MKALLTSIGSRGDVQPLLALALELRALGHSPLLCVAPNFLPWLASFEIDAVPLGPDLEQWTRRAADMPQPSQPPTPEQLRQLARGTVDDQFRALGEAARGQDLIVAGGMLCTAGRSIAEALRIPYVYASYCPATLPSPDHAPARMSPPHPQSLTGEENLRLWAEDARTFDLMFGAALNEHRAALGLAPVESVVRHITTARPWLAADPVLGPAGTPIEMEITQTGAWLLTDQPPLPAELAQFLDAGEPPLYLGFGSMRAAGQTGQLLVEAARAVGRRAILSQGWGNLTVVDGGDDCISIGDVAHARLFPRVAAVVHHGGAGTTTAAALAGAPQVIVPHTYDQHYWAGRVQALGIGVAGPAAASLDVDALVAALRAVLRPEPRERAQALAPRVEARGARLAAERLAELA